MHGVETLDMGGTQDRMSDTRKAANVHFITGISGT